MKSSIVFVTADSLQSLAEGMHENCLLGFIPFGSMTVMQEKQKLDIGHSTKIVYVQGMFNPAFVQMALKQGEQVQA